MKGMGKAMMGTGEAEGEKRAEEATNAALLNPLIDEYSLKGAKGLLVNITGGSDLTLFEVDEAVNKIRAEVDPEAELIFGSIEDERLNGKIRVSIVATALDGQEPESKPVVSMIHRLHNRNGGYSSNFVKNPTINEATINATEGATALNLQNVVEEKNITQNQHEQKEIINETKDDPVLENVSIENANYLQNIEESVSSGQNLDTNDETPNFEVDSIELATPELFSNDGETDLSKNENEDQKETRLFENLNSDKETETKTKEPEMFEESNSEEDFEIPAFLRRQKN
tara:strand:- start:1381 stop:2238 length:858 start_codon:yes stop_codon:yes gene_type:complete